MTADGSDAELIQRADAGDEAAFGALYARHQVALHRFSSRMGLGAAADDVVQEVFMALIRREARFDPARGSVGGFLHGIARNLVRRRLERERRWEELDEEAAVSWPDPVEDMTRARRVERLRAALASLPGAFREVVVLCDLQGLSYEETAVAVGSPVGTVRSRLSRARGLLAARLAAAPEIAEAAR